MTNTDLKCYLFKVCHQIFAIFPWFKYSIIPVRVAADTLGHVIVKFASTKHVLEVIVIDQ